MKKIIIILFLSFGICTLSAGATCKPSSDSDDVLITKTVPATTFQKMFSLCKCSIWNVAQGTDKVLEYLIKPKNLLKVSILLTPVAILYAKAYGQEVLDGFFSAVINSFDSALDKNSENVDKIIQHIGNMYAKYEIQVNAGKFNQFAHTLFTKPLSALSYGAYTVAGFLPKAFVDGIAATGYIGLAAKKTYNYFLCVAGIF